jgi:hypothetical protein
MRPALLVVDRVGEYARQHLIKGLMTGSKAEYVNPQADSAHNKKIYCRYIYAGYQLINGLGPLREGEYAQSTLR